MTAFAIDHNTGALTQVGVANGIPARLKLATVVGLLVWGLRS